MAANLMSAGYNRINSDGASRGMPAGMAGSRRRGPRRRARSPPPLSRALCPLAPRSRVRPQTAGRCPRAIPPLASWCQTRRASPTACPRLRITCTARACCLAYTRRGAWLGGFGCGGGGVVVGRASQRSTLRPPLAPPPRPQRFAHVRGQGGVVRPRGPGRGHVCVVGRGVSAARRGVAWQPSLVRIARPDPHTHSLPAPNAILHPIPSF